MIWEDNTGPVLAPIFGIIPTLVQPLAIEDQAASIYVYQYPLGFGITQFEENMYQLPSVANADWARSRPASADCPPVSHDP